MQNHRVLVWGKEVEDAYWKMENIDSYCRTVWIAAGLGGGLHRFTGGQAKELVNLRQKLGMPDPRANLKECELCDSAEFRPGAVCEAPAASQVTEPQPTSEIEGLVTRLTEKILKQLGAKKG